MEVNWKRAAPPTEFIKQSRETVRGRIHSHAGNLLPWRLGGGGHAQYVIEREIPGAGNLSDAELQAVARKSVGVLKDMGPAIKWLHSYVTGDKVYCVYLAPDEEPFANMRVAEVYLQIASRQYGA